MLRFHDPVTLVTVAVGALTAVSTISQAQAQKKQAKASANFDRLQAEQDALQTKRDLRDEAEANRRTTARTRAVLAAQGVDLSDNTALSLIADVDTESRIRQDRLSADTKVRQSSLRTRARNTESAGRSAATNTIIGGASRATSLFL